MAQANSNKPKSSSLIRKSASSNKKVVVKKRPSTYKSNTSRKNQPIIISNNEASVFISKAKDLFKGGFLLQSYRLLNQYKDYSEMDSEAFLYLAECNRSIGNGIDTDYKLSEQYFLQSIALKPTKEAFLSLGQLYELGGFKLKRDALKAVNYFQQAANEEVAFANFELGRLYLQGLPDSLKNETKGISLLELAGNQDVAEAQWMLGSIYAKGFNNIPKDMPKAKTWFKKYKENKTIKQEIKL
jgi:TPR repeat protein